jgi:1-deoxy-D-xylulose-5-phosphate reductoisomerase
MRRVLVLGSTGSIGVQALEVIDREPDLSVVGLSCGSRVEEMSLQAEAAGVTHTAAAAGGGTVEFDPELSTLMDATGPDVVVNAIVGAAGLRPTLAAIERGVPVALANKESLVVGGELVRAARERSGAELLPIDSEHSALWQLLEGIPAERVASVAITASGGPFRGRSAGELADVSVEDALAHPTWTMGAKITIDSATLMNKGLEVIEARHLFDLEDDQVEVVVHPQSIVHAMARLKDGALLAHLGAPDMRAPIAHALAWPRPPAPSLPPFDLVGRRLEFEEPDTDSFRCLALARQAGRAGGTAPAVLNAANEVAVEAFLSGRASFTDVAALVEGALAGVPREPADSLETVERADRAARMHVSESVEGSRPGASARAGVGA